MTALQNKNRFSKLFRPNQSSGGERGFRRLFVPVSTLDFVTLGSTQSRSTLRKSLRAPLGTHITDHDEQSGPRRVMHLVTCQRRLGLRTSAQATPSGNMPTEQPLEEGQQSSG